MKTSEAKADLAKRLNDLGMAYDKLTAKTVSFEGLGYNTAIFIKIDGATFKEGLGIKCFQGIPKPSDGGYIPEIGTNCKWER